MSWQTYLYELQSCVLDLLVWIPQVEVQKVKDLWFVNFTSADLIVLQLVPGVIFILVRSLAYFSLWLFSTPLTTNPSLPSPDIVKLVQLSNPGLRRPPRLSSRRLPSSRAPGWTESEDSPSSPRHWSSSHHHALTLSH